MQSLCFVLFSWLTNTCLQLGFKVKLIEDAYRYILQVQTLSYFGKQSLFLINSRNTKITQLGLHNRPNKFCHNCAPEQKPLHLENACSTGSPQIGAETLTQPILKPHL